jgi:hypothetical protein
MTTKRLLFASLSLLVPACIDDPELSETSQNADVIVSPIDVDPILLCPPTTPVFGPLAVTVPSPGKILSHAPIHYTTGNTVDIAFRLPDCTGVSEVRYGTVVLGTESGGIDAPSAYYEILSDSPVRGGGHVTTLRLHLSSSLGQGGAGVVRLTASSVIGIAPTATAELTLSRVKDIGAPASFSISEQELHNGLVASVYNQFGDDGDFTDPSSGKHFYDPVYSSNWLRIEPDGIRFNQRFAMSATACDPVVNTSGRFHLAKSGTDVEVVWDSGPTVDTDFDLLCSIVTLGIPQIVAAFVDPPIDTIKDRVEGMVDSALAASGCGALCASQIDSFSMLTDELRVNLAPRDLSGNPLERILIEIPYNTNHTEYPFSYGVPLRSGDKVVVMPAGRQQACTTAGTASSSTCAKAPTAPSGLFNWNTNVPVPNPWVLYGTVYAYYEERHEARNQLVGLTRDAAKLPLPTRQPASLVARRGNGTSNSSRGSAATPCRVDARAGGQDRVAFGANDYRSASGWDYGSGTYRITLGFLPTATTLDLAAANSVPSCF